MVTRRPRDFSRLPRLEAVSPLPSDEATPPVTKTCLVGWLDTKGAPVGVIRGGADPADTAPNSWAPFSTSPRGSTLSRTPHWRGTTHPGGRRSTGSGRGRCRHDAVGGVHRAVLAHRAPGPGCQREYADQLADGRLRAVHRRHRGPCGGAAPEVAQDPPGTGRAGRSDDHGGQPLPEGLQD